MKKLITCTIIFVLTSIIVSSCRPSSSIIKRRYNKGYYVHHTAKPAEPKTNSKVAVQKIKEPIMVTSIIPKQTEPTSPLIENKNYSPAAASKITASATHKATKDNTAVKTSKAKNTLMVMPSVFSAKQTFKSVQELRSKMLSADSDDDALSLLWIVIVIILIFYLLGFAFNDYGIGPLINLLAVVILVLLILWLLRIL